MGGGSPKTPKEDSSSSNSSLSIKKEEEKKEEGAAAPVFSFSFFQKLNLKEEEKEKILKEHSKEKIEIAVQRCLAWKNRDSDSAAIFAILKNFDTWKDPPKHEEILDRSTKFFKTLQCYDQKTYKNNYITVGNEYIEFAAGPKIKVFNLNDKNFESDVLKHIEYLKNL